MWVKEKQEVITNEVFKAIDKNINYIDQNILGVPASYLDSKVFSQDEAFLKNAPFLTTLLKNPNHIGCHTLGSSESFFAGTQEIEKRVIKICSVDILKGVEGEQDGYVASGGTEANIQAVWIYRNYFMQIHNACLQDIAIICSSDTHYSIDKASNLLCIDLYKIQVDFKTREIQSSDINKTIQDAVNQGKKYFIVIVNMMTTMFGSVDNIHAYTEILKKYKLLYKIHVDGAYGGFYYPFSSKKNDLNFNNPEVTSITLDAHKMAQAPYGTGIFLIKKGYMQYTNTSTASYVEGQDYTLIGSRSGANAVAIWMILAKNGPYGWFEKIFILQKRTDWLCSELEKLNIAYYRHPYSNIVTIESSYVSKETTKKFGLVPDNHKKPNWFKIVVMDHVTMEKMSMLLSDLKENL